MKIQKYAKQCPHAQNGKVPKHLDLPMNFGNQFHILQFYIGELFQEEIIYHDFIEVIYVRIVLISLDY